MRAELERRPLLVFCLALILGLTLARHPINLFFLVPAPWLFSHLRGVAIAVGGLLLGCLLGPGQPPPILSDAHFVDGQWQIVSLPKVTPFGQTCEIERGALRLKLLYDGPLDLCPGQLIRAAGVVEPPKEGTESFFASRALSGRLTVQSDSVDIVAKANWMQETSCSLRRQFLDLAKSALPSDLAAMSSALVFNADSGLDSETRDEMQRTGTTHIIAASGLQVVVIAQALFWLLLLAPVPRSLQIAVVATILVVYAFATGLHPPIVRAVVMSLLANAAYMFRREPDWPTALAASSILYLLWKPSTVYEMGFQFSIIAVLFISMFAAHVKWLPGLAAWLSRGALRSVRTAAVAYVVMAPIIAYYFGIVSLVSLPANLLVVMVVAPIVIVSLGGLAVGTVSPEVGEVLIHTTQWPIAYIQRVLHALGGDRVAFQVPAFNAYWLVPFYVLLILLWRPYVRPV